jgi:hypothetical protein
VLARPIAKDTGWSLAFIVAGLTLGLIVAGLASSIVESPPTIEKLSLAQSGREAPATTACVTVGTADMIEVRHAAPSDGRGEIERGR